MYSGNREPKFTIIDLEGQDTAVYRNGTILALFYGDDWWGTGKEEAKVFVKAMEEMVKGEL